MARKIVQRTWNITRNHSNFEYYHQFILAISSAKYYNLDIFEKFANDTTFDHVDFLQVAYDMRKELHIPPSPEYTNVITDMGVCHSTTELAYVQKPYRGNMSHEPVQVPDNTVYTAIDIFRIIITPHFSDTENVTIYIHNKKEIISGSDSIRESLVESTDIFHTDIEMNEILSTDASRGLSVKRRKCLYFDERALDFFPIYTINLCKMNCRIRAALFSCGCIPFFYNLNATEPICNAAGLYCLSKSDWYSRGCKCYPLCDSLKFVRLSSEKVYYSTAYSRLVEVNVIFPKVRIKRQIIFSIYGLIVSFGGGAAFFLGCSFLSSVEIVFYICEWFWNLVRKCTHGRCSER
ncbi:sodium channel protein Nach-like [Bradysia coprophila]|uniref:sodium channel protein Nach-like n=1 Tax=Bradysia coprophila TaxID=38358 RepID=UPI00187D79C7|nr:sodium channel protein Nach-like [Bradysia coprophila]